MTIKEIVHGYILVHGFDGLVKVDLECGCGYDDLWPCGMVGDDCEPAYKWECPECYRYCSADEAAEKCEWGLGTGCYSTKKPERQP